MPNRKLKIFWRHHRSNCTRFKKKKSKMVVEAVKKMRKKGKGTEKELLYVI